MYRIALVEDNPGDARRLQEYLARLPDSAGAFSVTAYATGEAFLAQAVQGFDLVFMDIELPGCSGMETARQLRRQDRQAILIFVTNMAQYAVKGYEVDALDFVVKPVSFADFAFKMKRALRALEAAAPLDITVPLPGGFRRLSAAKLRYVEVSGHQLVYHLTDETLQTRGRLADTERMLAQNGFLRCNNCYLVNPRHVVWVDGYSVKVGPDVLQISHPRRKAFLQGLNQWLAKGGQQA